jgi:hypothetical protein
MSSSDVVTLVLGLVGTSGLGLFLKQLSDALRGRKTEDPEALPAPQATAVVEETNAGTAALIRALTETSDRFDRLESEVARCAVPDCPVRTEHFRPRRDADS